MKNIDLVDSAEDYRVDKKDHKKGPGELVNTPIFQKIQNKLLNQMLG
jgi:hypothetical protein